MVVINLVHSGLAFFRPSVNSAYFFFLFPLFLTLPHEVLELTFMSVDEIIWCYHSNETSSAVLLRCAIWLCGWNPMVLPFKWNPFTSTFTRYYLYSSLVVLTFESVLGWISIPHQIVKLVESGKRQKRQPVLPNGEENGLVVIFVAPFAANMVL